MHCKQARDLLIESMDHTPGADEVAALRAHVDECPECQRFADATRHWKSRSAGRLQPTPDVTERVLATIRPLPPPWVYEHHRRTRYAPHLAAFVVGALGVGLTFLMICVALVVGLAGEYHPEAGQHRLLIPEVWHDAASWMNTIPGDPAHTAVTVVGAIAFIALVSSWFRTLSVRVGRGRD